jgi:apolipoprotein N-acyltransferase
MIQNKWKYLLALTGGVFYATGFPMFGDYTFIFGPVLGFLFLNISLSRTSSLKKQLLIGWCYAFGFYQAGYYWIPHLLKEFGGLPFPFNFMLGLVFSIILLPQVYIYIFAKKYVRHIIPLSLLYALLEYFTPQQFPAHLGHTFLSLAPTLPLNFASIFGVSFYSFIIAIFALSIKFHWEKKRTPWAHYSIILLALVASSIPYGHKKTNEQVINIRLVQPNIGNFLKVDSEKGGLNSIRNVFDSYYQLSTENLSASPQLIIWPETSFPSLLSSNVMKKSPETAIPKLFLDIIGKSNSELFVGGYDFNTDSQNKMGFETDYNAAFYYGKNGQLKDVYHKNKLIPFGEGLPFGPFNQFLSNYITNVSFFAKGKEKTKFKLDNGQFFSAAICYEILFPDFIRDLLNDPASTKDESNFIINLTNDSWYGDTFEPYQHLFLSKWRALEFNIPIIRSTNTGITTIIYPDGSESKRIMIFEKKAMDVEFKYYPRNPTIFQKFGIYLFIAFGLILISLEKNLLLKGHEDE